jgi:hypothetical protein
VVFGGWDGLGVAPGELGFVLLLRRLQDGAFRDRMRRLCAKPWSDSRTIGSIQSLR